MPQDVSAVGLAQMMYPRKQFYIKLFLYNTVVLRVPVYELLGGPTRDRIRAYAHASTPEEIQQRLAQGFTAFKTGPAKKRPARYIETHAAVQYAAEKFAELRKLVGNDVDLATDFHGAISPATAKLLIKALEPYQPMFVEEPCQAQNHDVMAEAYYASIAPHNPLGPISLAAAVQMAASIPNFLCQEQVSLGEGYLKKRISGVIRKATTRTTVRWWTGKERA
jgi:galactonate dehydratase